MCLEAQVSAILSDWNANKRGPHQFCPQYPNTLPRPLQIIETESKDVTPEGEKSDEGSQ